MWNKDSRLIMESRRIEGMQGGLGCLGIVDEQGGVVAQGIKGGVVRDDRWMRGSWWTRNCWLTRESRWIRDSG